MRPHQVSGSIGSAMTMNNAITMPVRILLRDFNHRNTVIAPIPSSAPRDCVPSAANAVKTAAASMPARRPFRRMPAEEKQQRNSHGQRQPDLVVAIDECSAGTAHLIGTAGGDGENAAFDAVKAERQCDRPDQRLQPLGSVDQHRCDKNHQEDLRDLVELLPCKRRIHRIRSRDQRPCPENEQQYQLPCPWNLLLLLRHQHRRHRGERDDHRKWESEPKNPTPAGADS